jgi:pyruvate formate-lyase activating enzyme-like uncharacterized protein
LRLRSESVAREYDVVDEEGMLTRGEIILVDDLVGGEEVNLERIKIDLEESFDIPEDLIEIDNSKERILIAPWIIEELLEQLRSDKERESVEEFPYDWFEKAEFAIVREYPTDDHFQLERTVL